MTHAPLKNTATPNLPLATVSYEKSYIDGLNNVLRLFFNQLNNTLSALLSTSGGAYLQFPNGAFHQDGHTLLTAAIPNSASTADVQVTSTTGFLDAAGIIIGDEILTYTGKTATTFTGITRGAFGSSASSHSIGDAVSEAQVITPPSTLLPIEFTATDASNGVTISALDMTKIEFGVEGYYNLQFSAQLLNYTTSVDSVTIWFRENGVDVANSAGIMDVAAKHGGRPGSSIAAWNIILPIHADDYIQLMMTSDSGNTVVATYPPGVSPGTVHPASPSIILTATFVSALYT